MPHLKVVDPSENSISQVHLFLQGAIPEKMDYVRVLHSIKQVLYSTEFVDVKFTENTALPNVIDLQNRFGGERCRPSNRRKVTNSTS